MYLYFVGKFGRQFSTNTKRIRSNTYNRRRNLIAAGILRNRKNIKSSGPDKDYGLAEALDELLYLNDKDLDKKKNEFLNKIANVNRLQIEEDTRDQSHSQTWHKERQIRLTASKFGEVCKMKEFTSCRIKVHAMLYKSPIICKTMAYGIEMEDCARASFEKLYQVSIIKCGLFIDQQYPYLAASPGIYNNMNYNFTHLHKFVCI